MIIAMTANIEDSIAIHYPATATHSCPLIQQCPQVSSRVLPEELIKRVRHPSPSREISRLDRGLSSAGARARNNIQFAPPQQC